jgi:excisionase family DNA binding protein
MTSELEVAFRHMLKSAVREVADEVLRERQSTEYAVQSKQPDQPGPRLLPAREAAKRLAISQRHLHKMTVEGLLPCIRIGRLVRYSVETIEQWIRKSESTVTAELRSKAALSGLKAKLEKPRGVSKSKERSPRPTQAKPSESKAREKRTRASGVDGGQITPGLLEDRPNPFRSLLKEIGVDSDVVGPLTNGELRRIADVDVPTFHGWMYLGREMPEEALEKLRRHFGNPTIK